MQRVGNDALESSTSIYFVRHGETRENVLQIVQGQLIDCPLNEHGLSQAEAVADRLSSVDVSRIYVSPLLRARQTASAIASRHSEIPTLVRTELAEMSFGVLEGQSYSGHNEEFFSWLYKRWGEGFFADRIEGGESVDDVRGRAVSVVKEIAADNPGRTVVVVTHGRWLRILLSTLIEGYKLERMDELLHRNTAVSLIRHAGGNFEHDFLASDEHLHKMAG